MSIKTFDIRKTGGEVDVIVFNLINHAYDDQEHVRTSIMYSLIEISNHQPELVLSSIASYVSKRHDRIGIEHRVQLLETMVKITEQAREKITANTADDIIQFAAQELTAQQDIRTDLHTAASQILVSLSLYFAESVISTTLTHFKPGIEPHYYIVRTLAETATSNPVSTVLFLRDILARVIPVLGLVKRAPMKWIFSTALGRFAEAITFFVSNADDAKRQEVDLSSFENDLCSAWDVLFTKWLVDGEQRVRYVVIESLGYIGHVLSTRDFDSRFLKIVPCYLDMYKKEPRSEHLAISLGLSSLLSKAVNEPQAFNNHEAFTHIMSGLHDLVCLPQQDLLSNPSAIKNNAEILRCWEILTRSLPDLTLTYIINKFQLKSTPIRIGSLVIIRHLVNSLDTVLVERRPVIMSSVTTLVNLSEVNLRMTILQTIASMANQGYLGLEGGESLVRFVAQQASIKIPSKPTETVTAKEITSLKELKRAADNLLFIFATKIPTAITILWPFVMELICDSTFSHGLSSIFRVIGEICGAKKQANDDSYILNLQHHVNIPSPQSIVAQTFLLLSQPWKQTNLGLHIANASIYIGYSIHRPLGEYWEETMPALIQYLDKFKALGEDDPQFNLTKWQDTILKVFRETLTTVSSETWLTELVQVITQRMKVHVKDSEVMRLLYRFLGAVLSRLQNKILIQQHIDLLLNTVKHNNDSEQRGVAQGIGMIANPHLDMVLPKITELLTTTPEHRKTSGFLGFGAKDLGPEDEVKATSVLAYGYITAYANPALILSRLDVHILHNIIPLLGLPDPKKNDVQKPVMVVKLQLSKALDLIGKTVHPSRLHDQTFVLKKRDELVRGLLQMVEQENKPTLDLRLNVLATLSTLSLLQPNYSKEMHTAIFKVIMPMYQVLLDDREIKTIYPPLVVKSSDNDTSDETSTVGKDDKNDSDDAVETDGEKVMNAVNTLWQSILQTEPTVDMVLAILTKLQPLLQHKKPVVRFRAISSYLFVLKKFVPRLSQEKIQQKEQCFPELGKRVSFIFARCGDEVDGIRGMAVECLQALLYLDQLLNTPENVRPRPDVKSLTELKVRIAQPVHAPLGVTNWNDQDYVRVRFPLLDQCVTTFVGASTSGESVELIRSMIPKLNDHDVQSGLGLSRMLSKTVSLRGQQLYGELDSCIDAFMDTLRKPMKKETKLATLSSLRLVTKMHFNRVMELLLKASTPLTREFVECFITLVDPVDKILTPSGEWVNDQYALTFEDMVSNKQLSQQVLLYLCNIMNDTPLDNRLPTPVVMAATCALTSIFQAACGILTKATVGKDKASSTVSTVIDQVDQQKKSEAASPTTKPAASAKKPAPSSGSSDKKAKDQDDVEDATFIFNYHHVQDTASQSALQSLLKHPEYYPTLVSTLLLRCGSAHTIAKESESRKSMKQAIQCIKAFFPAVEQNHILASLNDLSKVYKDKEKVAHPEDILNNQIVYELVKEDKSIWTEILEEDYDDCIAIIARLVAQDHPLLLEPIIDFLTPYYSLQAFAGHQVVATTIVGEFFGQTGAVLALTDASTLKLLQEKFVRKLSSLTAAKEDKVRKQALRGLGNFVLVQKQSEILINATTVVITSCSSATEDSSSEVAAEAVSSLSRVATFIDFGLISTMFIPICFRMRPTFDRKQAKVRKAAFALFAQLCRFGYRENEIDTTVLDVNMNSSILEQVHINVPIYLAHIMDKMEPVREAAWDGLLKVSRLLHPEIYAYVHEQVSKDIVTEDLDSYNTFLSQISKLLLTHHSQNIRGYLDQCIQYYSSNWNEIRRNAAFLTGCLIRHRNSAGGDGVAGQRGLNLHSITASLVKLLDQESDMVRNSAAKALALLYDI